MRRGDVLVRQRRYAAALGKRLEALAKGEIPPVVAGHILRAQRALEGCALDRSYAVEDNASRIAEATTYAFFAGAIKAGEKLLVD